MTTIMSRVIPMITGMNTATAIMTTGINTSMTMSMVMTIIILMGVRTATGTAMAMGTAALTASRLLCFAPTAVLRAILWSRASRACWVPTRSFLTI